MFRRSVRIALAAALLLSLTPVGAVTAGANGGPLVEPLLIEEPNFKLTDQPSNCPAEYKFDDIPSGFTGEISRTWSVPRCDDPSEYADVTVTVVIRDDPGGMGQLVDFEITGGKAGYVYVKGGPGGNLYDYKNSVLGPVSADSALHAPVNPNTEKYYGVSHVSFCLCADVRVSKMWEFTAPDDFADRGYTYTAYYTTDDPDGTAVPAWTAVPLSDGDGDGVWTATTSHDPGTTIWYFWEVSDGSSTIFTSDVATETLEAPGPYTNGFAISLKRWIADPPQVLRDNYVLRIWGSYSLDGVTWTDVELTEDTTTGLFTAETVLPSGTSILYKLKAQGCDGEGNVLYSYEGEVLGPEIITGRATVENDLQFPNTVKNWVLLTNVAPDGGAYYAAWAVAPGGPWNEVELVEVDGYPGVWAGQSLLVDGMTVYYKFHDASWQSGTLGPEAISGDEMTNEYRRLVGYPRTIGFWQNWYNHFTPATMALIVADVNSDAGCFSTYFTSGDPGDTGMQLLTVGNAKSKTPAPSDVKAILQGANAKDMTQMLYAQLLGLELNVSAFNLGIMKDGHVIGVPCDAIVFLAHRSGWDSPLVNPWYPATTVTVGQLIGSIESSAPLWTRAQQGFAKDICDGVNNNWYLVPVMP